MSAADRMKALRRRRKTGRVVLPVEVDEVSLIETLIETGRLSRKLADDRKAVADATAKLIDSLVAVTVE